MFSRMSDSGLMFHLCCHFAHHLETGSPRAIQLYDLALAGRQLSDAHWQELAEMTVQAQAEKLVLAALILTAETFGLAVPKPVLTRLAHAVPPGFCRKVTAMGLPAFAVGQ